MTTKEALIYTDGACKGNPGPGGWGCVLRYQGEVFEFGGAEAATTNNRMELFAALTGLQELKKLGGTNTELRTDSKYLIQGVTEWMAGWKKRDWTTSQGKPVLNQDLWMGLDEAAQGLSVQWRYVPAHSGVPGNERVDTIASDAAQNLPVSYYKGPSETYDVDLDTCPAPEVSVSKKSRAKTSSSSKKTKSSGSAYCYLSYVDGVLKKHTTWKECEAQVKGRRAARYRKATSEEHMHDILSEWHLSGQTPS